MINKKTIGIIGGGQLGKMLSEAAIKLGFKVVVIDPNDDCPASQAGARQIVAPYDDGDAYNKLADASDFITIEIEHIDTKSLKLINKPINPDPNTVELIKDKLKQKELLAANKLPVGDFVRIDSKEELLDTLGEWGPVILKSRFGGFDGRGNRVINSASDIDFEIVSGQYYAEKIIDFKDELAVIFARGKQGSIEIFPIARTRHERNICTEVCAPADFDEDVKEKALNTAKNVAEQLEGYGVFAIEMFLDQNNKILINEIAPRVHNSGHYTMNGCNISQFEQHIRAISGMDLIKPIMTSKACVMVNILGERTGAAINKGVKEAEEIEGVSVYIYGKKYTKVDRKMGHINALGDTIEEALEKAKKARSIIEI